MTGVTTQFKEDYARHRAAEGRGYSGDALRALPYLPSGAFARQWKVRARTFDAFVRAALQPQLQARDILDLGAGNGWLCHRLALMGHRCVALDVRDDRIDGLGAAAEFLADRPDIFRSLAGTFENIPLSDETFDIALFNASLHYAQDLERALSEAARVARRGGKIAILDSPFYSRAADGEAMVAEKKAQATARFGARADVLLSQNFIEYLTPERLTRASGLTWQRRRVLYPFWYEIRPLVAWAKGARCPSRFDLWIATKP